mmetsp:Transcript_51969/g.160114  ORF Transcript_51969/g.160114 Transcript_51969/m.160114 type:complete len:230 (-) Transcript_51969:168-857(-)
MMWFPVLIASRVALTNSSGRSTATAWSKLHLLAGVGAWPRHVSSHSLESAQHPCPSGSLRIGHAPRRATEIPCAFARFRTDGDPPAAEPVNISTTRLALSETRSAGVPWRHAPAPSDSVDTPASPSIPMNGARLRRTARATSPADAPSTKKTTARGKVRLGLLPLLAATMPSSTTVRIMTPIVMFVRNVVTSSGCAGGSSDAGAAVAAGLVGRDVGRICAACRIGLTRP